MSLLSVASFLQAETPHPLPVSSVVFPIVALSVFALLGLIAWSYRDVAHRHASKPADRSMASHSPTH